MVPNLPSVRCAPQTRYNIMGKEQKKSSGKAVATPPAATSATKSKSAKKKKPSAEEIKKRMESLAESAGVTTGTGLKKTASRQLRYGITMTTHSSTGLSGKAIMLKYKIHAWDAAALKEADVTKDLPADPPWYDKDNKENLCKLITPELAHMVIENVKAACPDSAKHMEGDLTVPKEYVRPKIGLIMLDSLNVGGVDTEKPAMFMTGKLFTLKDVMKKKFGIRYADIEFAGVTKAAWCVEINETSLAIEGWLKKMGWAVVVEDFRSGDDEDEEEEEEEEVEQ